MNSPGGARRMRTQHPVRQRPKHDASRATRHDNRVRRCISLFNYAGTITTALNSVAAQSISDRLELIVVEMDPPMTPYLLPSSG